MPTCPRCHQLITTEAVSCPHCRTALKAFGHPGITLHRAKGEEYLCDRCIYDADDTCTFPQRPHAKECTLFSDRQPQIEPTFSLTRKQSFRLWYQRNQALVGILALVAISFLIAAIATASRK